MSCIRHTSPYVIRRSSSVIRTSYSMMYDIAHIYYNGWMLHIEDASCLIVCVDVGSYLVQPSNPRVVAYYLSSNTPRIIIYADS
jgi:hypothetical protein